VSPIRHFGDYISAKFAVVGLSGTLRLELAEYDIGVSALCPGSVKSGLGENTVRQRPARAAFADDRSDFIRKSGWRYIEPIEAGRIVVRGVRGNWPFIFTHPEDRALIEARHTAMMAAFDALGAET
jgi:NAD(P)-dependent dehydrogenase (short-subunit alcohol dehydrogenase family)